MGSIGWDYWGMRGNNKTANSWNNLINNNKQNCDHYIYNYKQFIIYIYKCHNTDVSVTTNMISIITTITNIQHIL